MQFKPPIINRQFVCIVDNKKVELAAIISSYLSKENHYFPIFAFPSVSAQETEWYGSTRDEHSFSRQRASTFAAFVNNVLASMNSCDTLILAGLSPDQKSYLDFIKYGNVIEIEKVSEVDFLLSPFIGEKKILNCKQAEILLGLFVSLKNNYILKIDESAENIIYDMMPDSGIVIIENEPNVSSIIAINYSYSINANIHITEILDSDEQFLIKEGIKSDYDKIERICQSRIGSISFPSFQFATFFTTGFPYSLIIKNCIPCSYVDMNIRPDLFIMHNLLYEEKKPFRGTVVFSPGFLPDEETKKVSLLLQNQNYFVKELYGENADAFNLDINLKRFPFDLFHICSHGGKMDGYSVEQSFTDRNGVTHNVVYDFVFSYGRSMRKDKLQVPQMWYPKKFDGFTWRSVELKAQNYSHYVFSDMEYAISNSKGAEKKMTRKKEVPNSSAIQCTGSFYQPILNSIASDSFPVIFNNTCWSWFDIAHPFLGSGARGYVGTLWDVGTDDASEFAIQFYQNIFSHSIIKSIYTAMEELKGTPSENIYIYWGLHFATITKPNDVVSSKRNVINALKDSLYLMFKYLNNAKSQELAETTQDNIRWVNFELTKLLRR